MLLQALNTSILSSLTSVGGNVAPLHMIIGAPVSGRVDLRTAGGSGGEGGANIELPAVEMCFSSSALVFGHPPDAVPHDGDDSCESLSVGGELPAALDGVADADGGERCMTGLTDNGDGLFMRTVKSTGL